MSYRSERLGNVYRDIKRRIVIEGDRGREVYPSDFEISKAEKAYLDEAYSFLLGKYNVSVYAHDISYKNGLAALVQIDRFTEDDQPLDSKSFYLRDGECLRSCLSEREVDTIYTQREGSWIVCTD